MSKTTIAGLVVVLAFALLAGGCNYAARTFGGEATIELSEGERVENVTWKENSLWVLTKQDPNKKPITYDLKEYSNIGVLEGTVHIVEK